MKPFSNCCALGAPIGTMDLRVGGPSCTGSVADESIDIDAIRFCFKFLNFCCFKSQRWECEWRQKTLQNFAFFDPCKTGEGWWGGLYELFVPHLGSKHRYIFYPAAVGSLVTLSAVD